MSLKREDKILSIQINSLLALDGDDSLWCFTSGVNLKIQAIER